MTLSILGTVGTLLREKYGAPALPGEAYRWRTLVDVVAPVCMKRAGDIDDAVEVGPLRSARETSQMRPAGLVEALRSDRRPERAAGVLVVLARWWLEHPQRDEERAEAWDIPVEELRRELRALPGVSLTLADRILLLVGRLPVFPINRTTIRIASRHGWLEPTAEYDEWQALFTRERDLSEVSLVELHQWFGRVGHDHCGVRSCCDNCPLQTLLSGSGPVESFDAGED